MPKISNPPAEEGYTKIENEILDALVRIRIPGEARQIVDLVIRKTCGFHKEDDWIKLIQFSVATGLKKSACARAIKKALSMNIIQKDNDRYKLNKNYEQWEALPKQTARGKSLTEKITSVNRKDNESLTERLIPSYKRKYTKENITKESPISSSLKKFEQKNKAYKAAELFFNQILKNNPHSRLHACQNGDKERIIQRWAKDIDLLIRMDGQLPSIVEEVIRFATVDGFWGPNILSGAKLREKWDTLVAQMGKKKNADVENDYSGQLDFAGNPLKVLRPRNKKEEEDDVIIDPSTGNPAKTIILSPKTRKTVQEKFREGLL